MDCLEKSQFFNDGVHKLLIIWNYVVVNNANFSYEKLAENSSEMYYLLARKKTNFRSCALNICV